MWCLWKPPRSCSAPARQLLWFLSLSGFVPRRECLHIPLTQPCFFFICSANQTYGLCLRGSDSKPGLHQYPTPPVCFLEALSLCGAFSLSCKPTASSRRCPAVGPPWARGDGASATWWWCSALGTSPSGCQGPVPRGSACLGGSKGCGCQEDGRSWEESPVLPRNPNGAGALCVLAAPAQSL